MAIQNDKSAVEKLISGYGKAINSSNGTLIPTFYTHDAFFMPDGRKVISRSDLERDNQNLFKKIGYSIEFSVQEITLEGDFAFVQAGAQTTRTKLESGEKTTKTSQDFFVLRKEQDVWRIFRYIFNNVAAL